MTSDHAPVRTYGGWRRSRSIGLLGLGPAATFMLLGAFAALILVAALSFRLLLYVAPPVVLAGAAGVVRIGGVPLAQLAIHRLRWWHGIRAGYTTYRAEVVQQHAGILQLPGTLAALELLSAEDGQGGHYGLVRDRHSGYLTATIHVAPVSTWLADPADAEQWVANWGGWLASLGYLPALHWVTVTVDTAPDPGSTLTRQVAAAIDPAAPRRAIEILDQLVAAAPAAAASVDTRVSITLDPAAWPAQPRTVAEAVTETGQALPGLEAALGACGVSVLGRARAADIAGMVRTAFDPAARGEVEKTFVEPFFDVDQGGLIATVDDYRDVPLLEVRPPDVARY
ncbi:MAG: SCO6880 family protein, partial [Streptosporangiales bacterium]